MSTFILTSITCGTYFTHSYSSHLPAYHTDVRLFLFTSTLPWITAFSNAMIKFSCVFHIVFIPYRQKYVPQFPASRSRFNDGLGWMISSWNFARTYIDEAGCEQIYLVALVAQHPSGKNLENGIWRFLGCRMSTKYHCCNPYMLLRGHGYK